MNCILCGGTELNQYFSLDRAPLTIQNLPSTPDTSMPMVGPLSVQVCGSCGLIQLDRNLTVAYYREVIRSSAVSPMMREFRIQQFKTLQSIRPTNEKKYFEAGCGYGEYLQIAAELFDLAAGVEYSSEAVASCIERALSVRRGFGKSDLNDKADGKYSYFGCFNFIEHLPDPLGFLQEVKANLTAEAVGLIEVPNFDAVLQDGAFNDFSVEHLTYFDEKRFRLLLEVAGFEVIKIDSILNNNTLSATVALEKRTAPDKFRNQKTELRQTLADVLSASRHENAIWGAGHHSLTTISELGLERHIGLIVDSSTKKQGRYVPGTDLQIQSPAELNHRPPKCLLINASAYNEEIYREVQNKFGFIKNVYMIDQSKLKRM